MANLGYILHTCPVAIVVGVVTVTGVVAYATGHLRGPWVVAWFVGLSVLLGAGPSVEWWIWQRRGDDRI